MGGRIEHPHLARGFALGKGLVVDIDKEVAGRIRAAVALHNLLSVVAEGSVHQVLAYRDLERVFAPDVQRLPIERAEVERGGKHVVDPLTGDE